MNEGLVREIEQIVHLFIERVRQSLRHQGLDIIISEDKFQYYVEGAVDGVYARGDVVTFWDEEDPYNYMVKRIVAVAGDTVTAKHKKLLELVASRKGTKSSTYTRQATLEKLEVDARALGLL